MRTASLNEEHEAIGPRTFAMDVKVDCYAGYRMGNQTGARVIHSYDTERRKVLCGLPEQTSSTKHAAGVTCMTCRELLDRAPAADRPVGAPAGHGE